MPLRGGLTVGFVTGLLSNDSNQATETVFLRNISLQGQEQFALELLQHNLNLAPLNPALSAMRPYRGPRTQCTAWAVCCDSQ